MRYLFFLWLVGGVVLLVCLFRGLLLCVMVRSFLGLDGRLEARLTECSDKAQLDSYLQYGVAW